LLALSGLLGCSSEGSVDVESLFGQLELNPTGNAPLAARVELSTDVPVTVTLTIKAKEAGGDDYRRELGFAEPVDSIEIPVIGLYPGHENKVSFAVADADGVKLGTHQATVTTAPLPEDFPDIVATGSYAGDDFTFVTYIRAPTVRKEVVGLMVDKRGDIRWYSDFPTTSMFPMEVSDGTLYCGDGGDLLKRYDFLGNELLSRDISRHGYTRIHHDIFVKQNGNILLTVDRKGAPMIEDTVIEIDPAKDQLRRVWDLRDTLPDVADLFADVPKTDQDQPGVSNDPIHINSIWYDEDDHALVVCSQKSGVAKYYDGGQLKWMLTPHLIRLIDDDDGDGVSDSFLDGYDPQDFLTMVGDYTTDTYDDERYPVNGKPTIDYSGFEFSYGEFLLAPLDKDGAEISDKQVLLGFKDRADFAWPFRPHAVMLTDDGRVLVFDNGLARNFEPVPISQGSFSRAVEYEVTEDETDGFGGTVRQVWQHVLKNDPMWYSFSPLIGDVDVLPDGHRVITSGAIGSSLMPDLFQSLYGDGPRGALIVEVDPASGEEVHTLALERKVLKDYPLTELTAYRSERLDPYKYFVAQLR
jgi:arylsulfate sulfotransferase